MNKPQIDYDLLIVGGGINGAGIAADAAGRGLKVLLCEKSDLGAATSWASTKLIHGGLRYLENYEFSLVRKSLQERELLAAAAPHLIRPLAIQIPQLPHSRNAILIRTGLFLYDFLAQRKLFKSSRAIRFPADSPLNPAIRHGFEYWDGFADDSRLVVANALQARQHGADIMTRTECVQMEPDAQGWQLTLRSSPINTQTKKLHERPVTDSRKIRCRVVVNAAGPWVNTLLQKTHREQSAIPMRLVKGSHIVIPRLYSGDHAYLLQHHDGRVIFVIPYLGKFTLVGTTEQEFTDDLDDVRISTPEIKYLLAIINLYFRTSVMHSEVIHTFAGVRPLIEELGESATKVSRDYQLKLDKLPQPLLTIYGGKITTYRLLAEEAVNQLAHLFPDCGPAWTRSAKLPGGNFDVVENLFQEMVRRHAWLGSELITRWLRSYGTRSYDIVGQADNLADLGQHFGHSLYAREVDFLCQQEWARTADDILWRRSKLGYLFNDAETAMLARYLQQATQQTAPQTAPQTTPQQSKHQ